MARPRSSLLIASTILAGGVGVAAWHRRPVAGPSVDSAADQGNVLADSGLTLHVNSAAPPVNVLVSESPSNESSAAKTKQRVASLPQRPDPPAPTIGDSDYSGIAAHASPVRIPNDPAERVDSSPEGDERIRFHRLVDGDDLAALAARYLGDRGRAEEILTLNSDVLQRPDLLPLGKVIRIPPLNSTPAMPRSADPNADEELQTNTRLAPIR